VCDRLRQYQSLRKCASRVPQATAGPWEGSARVVHKQRGTRATAWQRGHGAAVGKTAGVCESCVTGGVNSGGGGCGETHRSARGTFAAMCTWRRPAVGPQHIVLKGRRCCTAHCVVQTRLGHTRKVERRTSVIRGTYLHIASKTTSGCPGRGKDTGRAKTWWSVCVCVGGGLSMPSNRRG
jgi:hypothetical protein